MTSGVHVSVPLPAADGAGAPTWWRANVIVRTVGSVVDVVVERGGLRWSGVHMRRAELAPEEAEQLAASLLAAAAAAREADALLAVVDAATAGDRL